MQKRYPGNPRLVGGALREYIQSTGTFLVNNFELPEVFGQEPLDFLN